VRQLRQKLELDPAHPVHLVTETGVGYRLVTGDGASA
jgi:two-component system KDP operon response regulator KdpE